MTGVVLAGSAVSVAAGGTVTLVARVAPAGASNKAVAWASCGTRFKHIDREVAIPLPTGSANWTAVAINAGDDLRDFPGDWR